jgi:AraC-like DNA-binding protein
MVHRENTAPVVTNVGLDLAAGIAVRYECPAHDLRSLLPSYAVHNFDPKSPQASIGWMLPGWAQLRIVLPSRQITVRSRKLVPLDAATLYGNRRCVMPQRREAGSTIIVDFSPAGFARWFNRPAEQLCDRMIPLRSFWSTDRTRDLINRLHGLDRAAAVKPILDDFFAMDLPSAHHDEPALEHICSLLAKPPALTIPETAASLKMTQPSLMRLSYRHFGFPFQVVIRQARFFRALTEMILADEKPDFGAVPQGYHDIPHYLRDAKDFLGMTPRRFLLQPTTYLRSVLRARKIKIGAPLPVFDNLGSSLVD